MNKNYGLAVSIKKIEILFRIFCKLAAQDEDFLDTWAKYMIYKENVLECQSKSTYIPDFIVKYFIEFILDGQYITLADACKEINKRCEIEYDYRIVSKEFKKYIKVIGEDINNYLCGKIIFVDTASIIDLIAFLSPGDFLNIKDSFERASKSANPSKDYFSRMKNDVYTTESEMAVIILSNSFSNYEKNVEIFSNVVPLDPILYRKSLMETTRMNQAILSSIYELNRYTLSKRLI